VEAIRRKYAPKMTALEEKIRRAQQSMQREQEQASSQKVQAALSVGGAILGAFFGRKTLSRTNITAATSAARTMGRTYKESQDVGRAGETIESLQQQYTALQDQLRQDTEALQAKSDPATETLEKVTVRPKKTNIVLRLFTLAWAPYRDGQPAWE
jgi:gas vesicle protein